MLIFDRCVARPLVQEDLAQILSWRNHPDIRQHMLTRHEISPDEHRQWFERASGDGHKRLLIIEEAGVAIGFVNFSGVEPGSDTIASSPSQVLQTQPFFDSFCTQPARSPVE